MKKTHKDMVRLLGKKYLLIVFLTSLSLIFITSLASAALGISDPTKPKLEAPTSNLISGNGSTTNIYINGSMNLTDYCKANGTNDSGVDCISYIGRNLTASNFFGNLITDNIYTSDNKEAIFYDADIDYLVLGDSTNAITKVLGSSIYLGNNDNVYINSNGIQMTSNTNITSNYFKGNGSLLTGVCLTNGTGCNFTGISGGSSNINGTNVWLGNLSLGYNGTRGIFDIKNGETITIGNPASASLTFLYGSGGYVDYGNCFEFTVYAYKVSGANTVYSSSPASATGCDDGTGLQSFVMNISWSAVSGATGYKIAVIQDDYYGAYNDFYINASSTSVIDDNGDVYISESPITVTPTSVLSGADSFFNYSDGTFTNNRNSMFNGEVNITGTTIIEDIFNIFKDYSGYTGANNLASVLFRSSNGTVKIRFDWHDIYGTWMDIRNSVGASSWIGEITYTNPSSTFFDDRIALFQVRTSPSSNGGGQFFLVTHTNTSDNFNYNIQMYENGAVTLGSFGGNDGVFTSPASKVWNRGNTAIGRGASNIVAPTDGLYVAGNSVFNGTINTTRINATYINVGNITVGDIIYSNNWSWYENGDTLQLRNATNGIVYIFNNTGNVGNPQAGGSTPNYGILESVANITDYTNYTKTYILANTSRTFFNLTNRNWEVNVFNISLSANTNYSLECELLSNTTTTTTGVQYNLSTSGTINWMAMATQYFTTATATTVGSCVGAFKQCTILGTASLTTPTPTRYHGLIETDSNAVQLTLNMRSEITQNVSTQRGSTCKVEKIV